MGCSCRPTGRSWLNEFEWMSWAAAVRPFNQFLSARPDGDDAIEFGDR